jgi:hypothetical protein
MSPFTHLFKGVRGPPLFLDLKPASCHAKISELCGGVTVLHAKLHSVCGAGEISKLQVMGVWLAAVAMLIPQI